MKRKTLIQLRDEDFADSLRKAAGKLAANHHVAHPDELIDMALNMRPRRFYLSFATIQARYHHMRKHGVFAQPAATLAQQQWHDFHRAIMRYRILHRRSTYAEAMSHVINFERPERFYLSRLKARQILRRTFHCEYSYVVTRKVS